MSPSKMRVDEYGIHPPGQTGPKSISVRFGAVVQRLHAVLMIVWLRGCGRCSWFRRRPTGGAVGAQVSCWHPTTLPSLVAAARTASGHTSSPKLSRLPSQRTDETNRSRMREDVMLFNQSINESVYFGSEPIKQRQRQRLIKYYTDRSLRNYLNDVSFLAFSMLIRFAFSNYFSCFYAFRVVAMLVWQQEGHPSCKKTLVHVYIIIIIKHHRGRHIKIIGGAN